MKSLPPNSHEGKLSSHPFVPIPDPDVLLKPIPL
jgi:hypothetical protein